MDAFGIGSAIKGCCEIYFRSARQTGRTSDLIDNLNDGDRIIFVKNEEARRWTRICKDIGKDIDCIAVNPTNTDIFNIRKNTKGTTVFDNAWIEIFYMNETHKSICLLDNLQKELSCNEELLETSMQNREQYKWNY